MSSPPQQQRDDMPTPVPAPIAAQAGPSTPVLAAPQEASQPPIKNLILDAAPLLTLFPLRGLAQKYLIAPQVLTEIRDRKAREHFDRLGLMEGVEVVVREPDAVSLAKVTAFAKQTGDYAVLSHTDMCVLALTYAVEVEENGHWRVKDDLHKPPSGKPPPPKDEAVSAAAADLTGSVPSPDPSSSSLPVAENPAAETTSASPQALTPKTGPSFAPASASLLAAGSSWGAKRPAPPPAASQVMSEAAEVEQKSQRAANEELAEQVGRVSLAEGGEPASSAEASPEGEAEDEEAPSNEAGPSSVPGPSSSAGGGAGGYPEVYAPEDPAELDDSHSEDDEETGGEWITPANVNKFKARDLGLALPESGASNSARGNNLQPKKPRAVMKSACMTSDFAVQNVLLQMGLNLVGGEGRRIRSVRSWVLRCHACFKLCKDPSKKFCPSCGSPTLLRVSVTTVAPSDPNSTTEKTTVVHLKKNYHHSTRGTRFSIPAPVAGSAKGQKHGGSGLILREDQAEFQRGVKREQGRRLKDDKRLAKAAALSSAAGPGALASNWMDPDWMPEMHAVGMSGKGRRQHGSFLPEIGTGRRNPNKVGKKKK